MNHYFTVLKKELKETFRDKRTVILSIILPLILFPTVSYFMSSKASGSASTSYYKIYADTYCSGILKPYESAGKIKLIENRELNDLKSGKLDLILEYKDRKYYMTFNSANILSVSAAEVLKQYLIPKDPVGSKKNTDAIVVQIPLEKSEIARGYLLLSIILPTLFFVFSVSASMSTAADLVTGEKERKTLEQLLSTPVVHRSLLLGKLSAVAVTGFLGVSSFFGGVYLAFVAAPDIFGSEKTVLHFSSSSAFTLILSGFFLVVFSSSVEILISLFSKTIKEAQIYFIPYLLLNSAIGYSVISVNPYDIEFVRYFIPLHNLAVIIKKAAVNTVDISSVFLVFLQFVIYSVIFLYISLKVMKSEKVMFKK